MGIFRRRSSTDDAEEESTGVASDEGQPTALGEPVGDVAVVVFGLGYSCWRCQRASTALVGLGEDVASLDPEDLVLCSDEDVLLLTDALLDEEARRAFAIGPVKPRYSRTLRRSYLSNGCVACDALFGEFPLFHEQLPEVLARDGLDSLVRIGVARISAWSWELALESRWS